jgi:hypothetical protein
VSMGVSCEVNTRPAQLPDKSWPGCPTPLPGHEDASFAMGMRLTGPLVPVVCIPPYRVAVTGSIDGASMLLGRH